MIIKLYWRLDPAAEPQRGEPTARPESGFLPRDVRTAALTRSDYYAQVARAAAITGFDGLFVAYRRERATTARSSQRPSRAPRRGCCSCPNSRAVSDRRSMPPRKR